jgi:hypothetical protein
LYAGIAVLATSCMVYVKEYPIESSTVALHRHHRRHLQFYTR